MKNAHFLQKLPYYQCGMAYYDMTSNSVKTMKFTSRGKLMQAETGPEQTPPREGSDSEDDELK